MPSFSFKRIYSNYNFQLFICSGLLTFSSANFGFDQGGFSQVQGMNQFARQFGGTCTKKGVCTLDSTHLSFLNGFPFLTFSVGSLMGSIIGEHFGRRWTVFIMSIWALMSASVCISAKTYNQILAGRCLNYVYAGMELSIIPVFQSELMPAPIRGFAVASYQLSISLGVLLMSIVGHFTSKIPNNNSWRIPFALFYVAPSIVASLIWFIPESPRFLLSKGRQAEARKALQRIRVHNDDESIDAEIAFIELGLAAHEAREKGSYADLFRGVSRRRTLITMGSCFFLQWSGQALNSNYGTVFVKSLGTINPFNYTIIVAALQLLATSIAMYLLDTIGRRPIMMYGMSLQSVMMFIIGAMGTITDPAKKHTAASVIVACVILFAFGYSSGWAAVNWVLVAEISDQKLRDKNQRVGTWVNFASNCAVTFIIPYLTNAPANLGAKVGFIFGSICFVGVLFGFFFVPELKGRTPEEINLLFDQHIGAIHSAKWKPEDLQGDLEKAVAEDGVNTMKVIEGEEDEKAVHAHVERAPEGVNRV